ncbi:hypothetical protein ACS0TY_029137 [Phlomoides rotata]
MKCVSELLAMLIILCLFWHFQIILASNIPATYSPPDNTAISCGSSGSLTTVDWRAGLVILGPDPQFRCRSSRSKTLFTEKACPYTLSNFSTSLASDIVSAKPIIKEYCVNVNEGKKLTITFSPAKRNRKSDNFFAFVNGIEVVSMPTGLYFSQDGDVGKNT